MLYADENSIYRPGPKIADKNYNISIKIESSCLTGESTDTLNMAPFKKNVFDYDRPYTFKFNVS